MCVPPQGVVEKIEPSIVKIGQLTGGPYGLGVPVSTLCVHEVLVFVKPAGVVENSEQLHNVLVCSVLCRDLQAIALHTLPVARTVYRRQAALEVGYYFVPNSLIVNHSKNLNRNRCLPMR